MKKAEMVWKMIPIGDLKPAAYNPRKKLKPGDKDYEKIKNSLREFGYVDPVIVNYDMTVIGGHQRLTVMKELGYEEVQCVVLHIEDEHKVKALNVALNKITGAWDEQLLADLLVDLQSVDFNVDLTGFEAPEVEQLFSQVYDKKVKEDNFDVEEELQKPAMSKTGDIWRLGRHTVICGDSTDSATYEKLLGETKVNLVCTDAPYFVKLENQSGKIANDNLEGTQAYDFLMKAFTNFKNAMAEDASIYEFYATMQARIFYDAFEDAGFKVGAGLVWKKPRAPFMRTDWKFNMEPIIFGWRKDGRHKWYGDQKQKAVFEFDGIKNSKEDGFGHPSSKPVALIAYLIRQSTQTNGIVLDGFLGSASTLMACDQIGRICYGIELEPKFVDVAAKRYLQAHDGKSDDVRLTRDGKEYFYPQVLEMMEVPDGTA